MGNTFSVISAIAFINQLIYTSKNFPTNNNFHSCFFMDHQITHIFKSLFTKVTGLLNHIWWATTLVGSFLSRLNNLIFSNWQKCKKCDNKFDDKRKLQKYLRSKKNSIQCGSECWLTCKTKTTFFYISPCVLYWKLQQQSTRHSWYAFKCMITKWLFYFCKH